MNKLRQLFFILLLVITPSVQANEIETIKISAVGDIMMHIEQIDSGYNAATKSYSYDYMFAPIKAYIESADLAIGNLETTLAGASKGYTGYPAFNAPEQLATALKNTGFDVLTLANNHSLDRRFYGIKHTIEVVEQAGLLHTGTARTQEEQDEVLIVDVKGIKIAIMSYTYGTNGIPMDQGKAFSVNLLDRTKMSKDIRRAREAGADLICVSLHFGDEYILTPNQSQRDLVNFLQNQGVDIVLGSHPHVNQPMVWNDNGFVIYSLGNFISAQTTRPRNSSIILQLTVTKNFTTNETHIDSVDYVPIWTDLSRINGKYNFRVLPVETALSSYEKGSDAYLTSADYTKLQQSLLDTRTMYPKPEATLKAYQMGSQVIDVSTYISQETTMTAIRPILRAIDFDFKWDNDQSELMIYSTNNVLKLKIGQSYGQLNGEWIKLSHATTLRNGTTYVPLRSVMEALGFQVSYDENQFMIYKKKSRN